MVKKEAAEEVQWWLGEVFLMRRVLLDRSDQDQVRLFSQLVKSERISYSAATVACIGDIDIMKFESNI